MRSLTRRQLLQSGAALGLGLAVRPSWATPPTDVRVDPIFEWWSALCRAAGLKEYCAGLLPAWNQALDRRLARVRRHRVIRSLRRLHATHGVSYDAIPSLAAHLIGSPEAMRPRLPWAPFPGSLDDRWAGIDLEDLIADASDAAQKADFSGLLDEQRALLEEATSALRGVVEAVDLGWFQSFFGAETPGRFVVYGGLSVGPNNYGATVNLPEGTEIVAVLNTTERDGRLTYEDCEELLVHELGHHWANPVIEAHAAAFEAAGERVYAQVRDVMRASAYGDGQIVLQESLLRAAVVRYCLAHGGEARANEQITWDTGAGFTWVGALSRLLGTYEADRTSYPDLGAFVPQLVAFFEETAADLETLPQRRPRVVSMTPANGSKRLDPATAKLVVVFDRPMTDQSWAICGGGPKMPRIDGPRYDESRTVFTAEMHLEPNHDYEFWLNAGRFQSFRAADGTPLESVHVQLSTGPTLRP